MTYAPKEILKLAKLRGKELGVTLEEVESKTVGGAYDARPLNLAEYVLHEAAHLVTLGYTPVEFPKLKKLAGGSLTTEITYRMTSISKVVSDALELDTALITFLAGRTLGFWEHPKPIIESCAKNLRMASVGETLRRTRKFFRSYSLDYEHQADTLESWFRFG